MILFPNCKINLGLNILEKRSDGYHNIETIFYPIPFTDILEITEYNQQPRTVFIPFSLSGLAIEGDLASNLCLKAYTLLKKDFSRLPHIRMHLHKTIPAGAGLGGGSADASFCLILLNKLFNLDLTDEQLAVYAGKIGSDCPFFIFNKPCVATGRGEIIEEVKLDLSGYKIIIANPGIHVSTGDAFREINPAVPEKPLKEIINMPVEKWKYEMKNDFEKIIFKKHPAIVDIKDGFYQQGAVFSSMSGSGSTVYGIFPKEKNVDLSFPENYFIKEFLLG